MNYQQKNSNILKSINLSHSSTLHAVNACSYTFPSNDLHSLTSNPIHILVDDRTLHSNVSYAYVIVARSSLNLQLECSQILLAETTFSLKTFYSFNKQLFLINSSTISSFVKLLDCYRSVRELTYLILFIVIIFPWRSSLNPYCCNMSNHNKTS